MDVGRGGEVSSCWRIFALAQVFKSPNESLGDIGALSAAKLIAATSDVALVVDRQGVVRDVAFNKDELASELDGQGRWLGTGLVDLVTSETKPKIESLLKEAAASGSSNWRQVNHPTRADDIPVQ